MYCCFGGSWRMIVEIYFKPRFRKRRQKEWYLQFRIGNMKCKHKQATNLRFNLPYMGLQPHMQWMKKCGWVFCTCWFDFWRLNKPLVLTRDSSCIGSNCSGLAFPHSSQDRNGNYPTTVYLQSKITIDQVGNNLKPIRLEKDVNVM